MNKIRLNGIIRDIDRSHTIGDIEFDKANIVTQREDGTDDIINLRFKRFSNEHKDGDKIDIIGNIRSFSRRCGDGTNKVDIYVFTYFDKPEDDADKNNHFVVDGRICKIDNVRTLRSGKKNIHFILANNLDVGSKNKLNSYLPCIAWGKVAQEISKMGVNDFITISGRLQSREYKKYISDNDFEIRVAHELFVEEVSKADDKEV